MINIDENLDYKEYLESIPWLSDDSINHINKESDDYIAGFLDGARYAQRAAALNIQFNHDSFDE